MLHQHLPELVGHDEHRRVPGSFDDADHDVRLAEGSLALRAAGESPHTVKSHHHQGPRFALGVQWHPEADERSRLIGALVAEARERRLAARPVG